MKINESYQNVTGNTEIIMTSITKNYNAQIKFLCYLFSLLSFLSCKQLTNEKITENQLPNGIYFFYGVPGSEETLNPLFIKNGGELIDPYDKSIDELMDRHVDGKVFYKYYANTHYSTIENISLNLFNVCSTHKHDIRGSGISSKKEAMDIPGYSFFPNEKGYGSLFSPILYPEQMLRPEHSPAQLPKKIKTETANHIKDIAHNHLHIKLEETFKTYLSDISAKVIEENAELPILDSIDLDNNQKNEFVGVYTYRKKLDYGTHVAWHAIEVPFVLLDNEEFHALDNASEIIYADSLPLYFFGGTIDLDLDGSLEIILARRRADEYLDVLKSITIIKHSNNRWTELFRSNDVCLSGGYY